MTTTRNLLDLHVPVDPDGTAAAVAPLAWCVTKRLTDLVEERGFTNPHLLVVNRVSEVMHAGNVEYRDYTDKRLVLVPLKNAMTFLSFAAPGENEIHAFVIDLPDHRAAKSVKKWVNDTNRFSYGSCLDDDGMMVRPPDWGKFLSIHSELVIVHVPAEMFAKPPAEWRKKMVQKFYKSKSIDQCHLRRRSIIALPLAAIVATLYYVAKLIVVLSGYATGFRGYALSAFKHPLGSHEDLWKASPKLWFAPAQNKEGDFRISVWTGLNLIVAWIAYIVVLGCIKLGWGTVAVAVVIAIMVIAAAFAVWHAFNSDMIATKRMRARQKAAAEDRIANLEALRAMMCETNMPANSFSELPSEKKTFSLRFNDFKTKVCKPFAA